MTENITLRIALAQINPILGDMEYNKSVICKFWDEADTNADLVVFPEMCICGYPPEDLVLKAAFLQASAQYIDKLVTYSATKKSAILISAPLQLENGRFNCALLIEHGRIIATVLKHHLPNYGVFDEQRIFDSGPLPHPVSFRGMKLGIMICEDMWFSDVASHLKQNGAEILIVPNGSPFSRHHKSRRQAHALNRVKETGLPLIYVNQVGGQDELVFDGSSFALNSKGIIIHQTASFIEKLEFLLPHQWGGSGLDISHLLEHTLPESSLAEIYDALILGLRDYISKNSFPGILLGLSGGIDSALSALIAVDALGPERVHCVMMPSQYTSTTSLEDAQTLASSLHCRLSTVSIEGPYNALCENLSPFFDKSTPGTTYENIQPRTRGLILMALSNASGDMVLSTGNKSEMAVGYATLYGDMCGGFNVLKDLYKTEVYALSHWRNSNKPLDSLAPAHACIAPRIIHKAPTAELKPNQTDQDTLPPYSVLDSILELLIENEKSLEDIIALGYDKNTILMIWKMLDRAEYKRRQAAPGVKITSRAFGRDRRYPITNRFLNIIEKA